MSRVFVVALTDEFECNSRAAVIAARLGARVTPGEDLIDGSLCLFVAEDSLQLGRAGARQPRHGFSWSLRRPGGGKRDPLLRAVGAPGRRVLDATAGFGNDSFILAQNGYAVTATEREASLGVLFEDSLARAAREPELAEAASLISFHAGDAREVLSRHPDAFDTIYLDPMYPPKRKQSALPRLPMQLLQELVGEDDDLPELVDVALRSARDRVVIKRPPHARPLLDEPTVQYEGKLVRYDVYYRRA